MAEQIYFTVRDDKTELWLYPTREQRDAEFTVASTIQSFPLSTGETSRSRLRSLVKLANEVPEQMLSASIGLVPSIVLVSAWSRFNQTYKTR